MHFTAFALCILRFFKHKTETQTICKTTSLQSGFEQPGPVASLLGLATTIAVIVINCIKSFHIFIATDNSAI